MMPSTISRSSTSRRRPPCLAGGISGAINTLSASVRVAAVPQPDSAGDRGCSDSDSQWSTCRHPRSEHATQRIAFAPRTQAPNCKPLEKLRSFQDGHLAIRRDLGQLSRATSTSPTTTMVSPGQASVPDARSPARAALGLGADHGRFGARGTAPRSNLTPSQSQPWCLVVGDVACARGRPPSEGK